MKRLITCAILVPLLISPVFAGGAHYEMRVDGLACPFCAFGVEKKLKAIKGANNIEIDLNKGLVKVDMPEGRKLTNEQMKKLFNDSGFTFRSMTEIDR